MGVYQKNDQRAPDTDVEPGHLALRKGERGGHLPEERPTRTRHRV